MIKEQPHLVVTERMVTLKTVIKTGSNNSPEKVVTKKLSVSVFPKGVPLTQVRVRTHGTFNMGNYSSVQASVELEDSTISNPEARVDLVETLSEMALEFTSKIAQRAADKFFQKAELL